MKDILNKLLQIKETFSVLNEDTSPDERNIRKLLRDEYDAIVNYEEFAAKAENDKVRRVLNDIMVEEKVHAGELRELLRVLGMSDDSTEKQGAEEVAQLLSESSETTRAFSQFELLDIIAEKTSRIEELEKQKNDAYSERDKLVSFISKMYPSCLGKHDVYDKDWDAEWTNIVYINSPQGQLSWHIKDDELPLFNHLNHSPTVKWDGHSTEEKYNRLANISLSESKDIEKGLPKQGYKKSFDGVSLGKDKDGYFVYTHRARSKSYEHPDSIPTKDITFIESTG